MYKYTHIHTQCHIQSGDQFVISQSGSYDLHMHCQTPLQVLVVTTQQNIRVLIGKFSESMIHT